MQRPALIQSLKARFHRSQWGGILAFLLLLALWRILEGEILSAENAMHHMAVLLLLAYAYALSPLPWQWTGDGRRRAPLARGVMQALAWNALWIALLVAFPLAYGDPNLFLGREEISKMSINGHPSSGLALALFIASQGLWISCLTGWFFAREEAIKIAEVEATEKQKTLELAARQAQVQALQSQLDPHVLYNALSGISELVHEEPDMAEEALVHLSDLYRKLTALGKRESVTLREEREVLQDYLAVEQVRLGSRLRVSWDWPDFLDDRKIAPLLIQPLVENAIKHGLSPQEEGGDLHIGVSESSDARLCILVANNGASLDAHWQEGTGLANLSARLALLGGGSSLQLRQEGNLTVAEMRLNTGATG